MSNPRSNEASPRPIEAESADLAKSIASKRMLAEIQLRRTKTSFLEDPEFAGGGLPLPKDFIDVVKRYLMDPVISVPEDWPPRAWQSMPGLQRAVEKPHLLDDEVTENILQKDVVFNYLELGLVKAGRLMPSSDPYIEHWRAVVKACYHLRTDELGFYDAPLAGQDNLLTDQSWVIIANKLQESRPDGV